MILIKFKKIIARKNIESSFVKDLFTTSASRAVYMGLGFLVSVLLARYLKPEGRGVLAAIMVIPNIMVLIGELGLRQAATYYIGKKLIDSRIVAGTLGFLFLPTCIISISLTAVIFKIQGLDQYGWELLGVALLFIPVSICKSYFLGVGMGFKKIWELNISEMIYSAVYLLTVLVLVVFFDLNVLGAIISMALSVGIQAFIIYRSCIKKYTGVAIRYVKGLPMKMVKTGIVYALSLFIMQILFKINVLFLNHYVDKRDLGLYVVAISITEVVLQVSHIIGFVVLSHSSNAEDQYNFSSKNWRLIKIITPLSIFSGIAFCFIAKYIIPFVYGFEYSEVSNLLIYLMPGVIAAIPYKIMRSDLAGQGKPEVAIFVTVIALTLNIGLNFIVIPKYGVLGAAINLSVIYVITTVLFSFIYRIICFNRKGERMDIK